MKVIVAYDSVNGNTKQVAEAMVEGLRGEGHDVELLSVRGVVPRLSGDVLFIGSPTRGGKPTKDALKFMESLDAEHWRSKPVFAFDTVGPLSKDDERRKEQLVKVGQADKNAATHLREAAVKRGLEVKGIEHFAVVGMWGPLAVDATSLAREWASRALASAGK